MADKQPKSTIRKVIETIVWGAIFLLVGFIAFTGISGRNTELPIKSYLIQSGSMEPTIMVGDIILVQETNDYQVRDTITYFDHGGRVVTHRILEKNEVNNAVSYVTKGDANEAIDPSVIPESDVIGEVVFVVPKLGFIVAWSRTKFGIVAMVLIPTIIIIYDEIRAMFSSKKSE